MVRTQIDPYALLVGGPWFERHDEIVVVIAASLGTPGVRQVLD
jgi:hypothetical protein